MPDAVRRGSVQPDHGAMLADPDLLGGHRDEFVRTDGPPPADEPAAVGGRLSGLGIHGVEELPSPSISAQGPPSYILLNNSVKKPYRVERWPGRSCSRPRSWRGSGTSLSTTQTLLQATRMRRRDSLEASLVLLGFLIFRTPQYRLVLQLMTKQFRAAEISDFGHRKYRSMVGFAGEDALSRIHLEFLNREAISLLDWYTLFCHPGNGCGAASNCESTFAAIAGLSEC